MTFQQILDEEITKRGWSTDRAARKLNECGADVATSTVNKWRTGQAIPNLKYCEPIHAAFPRLSPAKLSKAAALQARRAA